MSDGDALDLRGRRFVVAGAGGGGIGTAVCRALVRAGGEVMALDSDEHRLEAAAALGDAVLPSVCDVRDADAVERVLAALVTSQAVARRLVDEGRGGSIVYIASIAALASMPFGAAYATAKAGVLALMRTQAVEWGRHGVRVNAVAAGTIATPKTARGPSGDDAAVGVVPLGRRGVPDDVAGAVLYLCSGLATFVTGHTLVVDGGSSVRSSFLGPDDIPVFVEDPDLRARLRGPTA